MKTYGKFILIYFLFTLCSIGVYAESLYQANNFKPLASDKKAYQVGDVITVLIIENSTASTNADTNSRRRNNIGIGITPDINDSGKKIGANLAIGSDFDGGGRTQRTGKLLAQVTVNVKEILANGDLKLAGEQSLTINEELQKINLEGRVRPQDISDSNVVLSTRLADAKIVYAGEGDVSDRKKTSWWRTFTDWIGL